MAIGVRLGRDRRQASGAPRSPAAGAQRRVSDPSRSDRLQLWHVRCDAPIRVADLSARIDELVAQTNAARARYQQLASRAQRVLAEAEARLMQPASLRQLPGVDRATARRADPLRHVPQYPRPVKRARLPGAQPGCGA